MEGNHDVFEDGHIREKPYVLKGARDAQPGDFVNRPPGDVIAFPVYLPGAGGEKPGYDVENGCLPGAVRPDESNPFALLQVEREPVDGHEAAELHRDSIQFEKIVQSNLFLYGLRSRSSRVRMTSQFNSLLPMIPRRAKRMTSMRSRLKMTILMPGIPGMITKPRSMGFSTIRRASPPQAKSIAPMTAPVVLPSPPTTIMISRLNVRRKVKRVGKSW